MNKMHTSDSALSLSRRKFLIGSTGTGLVMAFGLMGGQSLEAREEIAERRFAPTIWWEMDADGILHINIIKVEMGHHIGTAQARIVADELEINWADVRIIHADSATKWGMQETGGSTGLFASFNRMSQVGAAGRIALIEAGAKMLGGKPEDARAEASKVILGNRSVSYADIVRSGKLNRTFTPQELSKLPIKAPSERRLIGVSGPQLDIRSKTDGSAKFGIDAAVPGMIYARPKAPPTRLGSEVVSVDESDARKVDGYVGYVIMDDPSGLTPGWVTVAAETYWGAVQAADALHVEWKTGPQVHTGEAELQAEALRLCADPKAGSMWVKEGDIDKAIAGAAKTMDARYTTTTALHFTLEPANTLAVFEDGIWNIHMGTQWQSLIRPIIAKALDVPIDNVVLRTYYLGGGFGRRLWSDYAVLAALTAKKLGRPVKLVFTRPDDTQLDCVRSPTVQTLKAAFDEKGTLTGIDHAAAAAWPLEATDRGAKAGWPEGVKPPSYMRENIKDGGKVDRYSIAGADHWYTLPHHRVRAILNEMAHQTFVPGFLRSVGPGWVTWATESFFDEIAHAQGKDPAAFRLAMLDAAGKNAGDQHASVGGAKRQAAVLKRAMEKAGWGTPMPRYTGLGLASAFGQERDMPTWTACVARVRVDPTTGAIHVEKLTHVLDCGTRVDPDGALAQAEGGTLWGVSLALHEGSSFDKGRVTTLNLDTYTPLRMSDVPELDIEFIDNTEFPTGMGEPPVVAIAPAIGNAIFAAAGIRLRDLPMRPEHVLRALRQV